MTETEPRAVLAKLRRALDDGRRAEIAVATGLSVSGVEKCLREKRLPRNKLVRAALVRAVDGAQR